MNVFVHLDHGFGLASWKRRWREGTIIGINHEDPYGYRQAEEMGCNLQQSEDRIETKLEWVVRRLLRKALGFDLLHAWRNREGIYCCQAVWTYTEVEALAVLLLLKVHKGTRPKVVAESVWLMDAWDGYSWLRRLMYRWLLNDADALTFHSRMALKKAQAIFPGKRAEFIRYGIRSDQQLALPAQPMHTPAHVLMVGHDRHRDWATFVDAVGDDPRFEAKLVARKSVSKKLSDLKNVIREQPSVNEGLLALFRWADVVVICLKENLHASGITVIEEAVLCGVPVICSDLGGLKDYFSEDEVTYVPGGNPEAVRVAIEMLRRSDELRLGKAERALEKMKRGTINSRTFVAKHVELSRELLLGSTVEHFSVDESALVQHSN